MLEPVHHLLLGANDRIAAPAGDKVILQMGQFAGRCFAAVDAQVPGEVVDRNLIAFFDDAVTAFFSPHAAGKSLMFLVGLGRTGTPNRVRPFRSKYGVLKDSLARGAGGDRRPVPDWIYSN